MSEGLEGLSVAAMQGLHVSVPPKVPSPHPDNRQHFQPGVPQLDVIRVDVYGSDFSGIQRLVDEAAAGNPAQVTGTLTIDDQRNNPLFEVDFDSLVPVAWTPFPTVVAHGLEYARADARILVNRLPPVTRGIVADRGLPTPACCAADLDGEERAQDLGSSVWGKTCRGRCRPPSRARCWRVPGLHGRRGRRQAIPAPNARNGVPARRS